MYLSHFDLKQEPFRTSPDPEFLWMGEKQTMAFQRLRQAVLGRDGCVALTGDIGTGKTTFIKRLVQLEDVAAVFVTAGDPGLNRLDFCNLLAAEFGLTRRFDRPEDFYADFSRCLRTDFSACRKVLVIIDEAHRLNPDILQEAAGLSELQVAERKPLKIIFVGQPEFNRVLMDAQTREVRPNFSARCDLEPLTENETRCYVEHRLNVAGRRSPLFSADAIQEIHALSKGYPRLINIVCDHALLYGYSFNLKTVDGKVVKDCSRDLTVALDLDDGPLEDRPASTLEETVEAGSPQSPAQPRHGWRSFLYMGAALAAAGLALYFIMR